MNPRHPQHRPSPCPAAAATQTLSELGRKARDGTISIDDMAGGTFTISNGGVYGSMLSTPIINPPQVGPGLTAGGTCIL
jgi:pyruvate/2-oxoglutarate dehydrogenase complex dihydrolipoamide acyltransferase (E2) component